MSIELRSLNFMFTHRTLLYVISLWFWNSKKIITEELDHRRESGLYMQFSLVQWTSFFFFFLFCKKDHWTLAKCEEQQLVHFHILLCTGVYLCVSIIVLGSVILFASNALTLDNFQDSNFRFGIKLTLKLNFGHWSKMTFKPFS